MSLALKAARSRAPQGAAVRGDPGFWGFLGKAAKGALGIATGGLSTAALDLVGGAISGPKTVSQAAAFAGPVATPTSRPGVGAIQLPGGRTINPLAFPPGGTPFITGPGSSSTNGATAMAGKPPSGFHWNKAGYFLKSGAYVAPGTKLVKNRRRNPLNPRALRSAVGRVNAGKVWQGALREIETAKYTKAGNKK